MMLEAVKNGATYVPAVVQPGQMYWKLIRADGPEWWEGKHSIFVDVWQEDGARAFGKLVEFAWPGHAELKPIDKVGEPFGCDFPMFNQRPAFSVQVAGVYPSDCLSGLGLVPFEKHMVWKLIFQLTRAEAVPVTPPPPTPPGNQPYKDQLILDGKVVWQR